jgi:hypothetical protein
MAMWVEPEGVKALDAGVVLMGEGSCQNKKRCGSAPKHQDSMHCEAHHNKFASALATALQGVIPNGRMPVAFHNGFASFAIFINSDLRNPPCKSGLS